MVRKSVSVLCDFQDAGTGHLSRVRMLVERQHELVSPACFRQVIIYYGRQPEELGLRQEGTEFQDVIDGLGDLGSGNMCAVRVYRFREVRKARLQPAKVLYQIAGITFHQSQHELRIFLLQGFVLK